MIRERFSVFRLGIQWNIFIHQLASDGKQFEMHVEFIIYYQHHEEFYEEFRLCIRVLDLVTLLVSRLGLVSCPHKVIIEMCRNGDSQYVGKNVLAKP